MAYPGTFSDIQDAVIAKLRLDPDLDTDKVKDWINQAYMEACMETQFYVTDAIPTSPLPANTGSTGVPASILAIDYVTSTQTDGSNRGPMDLVGIDVILEKRAWGGGATPSQGAPQMYAYRSGPQPLIEFWPPAAGGEVLTFYGARLPPTLVADGDVWLIPEPYGSNLLEFGADAQAAEFKQNFIMMSTYQQESAGWLQRFRGFQNNRAGNQPQQFRIVHAYQPVPASNSVDTPANW